MKFVFRIFGIILAGFAAAVIIYPFLHEAGHWFVAMLLGADVVGGGVFPLPYIMVDAVGLSSGGIVAIGLGGVIVPYVISMLLSPKSFWLWYTNMAVRAACLIAISVSLLCVLLWIMGISVADDDIIQILGIFEDGCFLFLTMLVAMFVYGVEKIIKEKPTDKIDRFFSKK